MKAVKAVLTVVVLVTLAGCIVEPTPTPTVSPVATPEAQRVQVVPAQAQYDLPGDPPDPGDVPSLRDVFTLIAAGAVGGIIAFLFERFQWFHNLSNNTRFWVIMGMSVGLPLLAQVALQFVPDDVWVILEPYWKSIALGFLAFIGSQVAHAFDKRALSARRG